MNECLDIETFKSFHLRTLDEGSLERARRHLSSCEACKTSYANYCRALETQESPASNPTETIFTPPPKMPRDDSAPTSRAMRHLPRIEGYQIISKLGQGGMGIVYRAVQTKLKRTVALKVLPAVVADSNAIARFRREAMSAAALHHTNIVPIYDFGESHDGHYYAMELIEGKPLNEVIDAFAVQKVSTASSTKLAGMLAQESIGVPPGPASPQSNPSGEFSASGVSSSSAGRGRPYFRQVAQWMADAADALHYAHGQGVIHRDIKPGNMILSKDGRIMITDFGLAKTKDDTSISVVGALMGALRYLSPEQAMAGRVPVDHRSDIWSLGATLYEMLTFTPAFPGTDEKQILSAIISREPVSPRKIEPHVPADLETICLKALEKNPEHRYATARAMTEDIQRWLKDIPIVAKRAGPLRRALKFARRNRAASTAVVSALIIAALGFGFVEAKQALQVDKLINAGRLREREGDWKEAEATYREAMAIDPHDPKVMESLARALQEQLDRKPYTPEMVVEALTLCENARAKDPTLPNIENTYGVLLSMAKRTDEALAIFKRHLPTDGPAAHIWSNIAAVHYLSNHDVGALEALRNAIEKPQAPRKQRDGSIKLANYYHGYHELATIQLMRGDAQAVHTIQAGLDLQPENEKHFTFYLVQARILLTLPGQKDTAGSWVYAAAEVAKGLYHDVNPDPYIERYHALALLRNGMVDRARESIERAREAQDLPVFVHLLTALAEAKAGNAQAAQDALKNADQDWPAELRADGATVRTRHLGMIWFESEDELNALRAEVLSLLGGP